MTSTDVVAFPKNHAQTQEAIERLVIQGDMAGLSPAQRSAYYLEVCKSLGLNPLTKPFEYIRGQNGKLVLYARKDATDQLRSTNRVSITALTRQTIGDVLVVVAHAALPDGRSDQSIGAVPVAGLRGEALANAFMRAETKAKRRVTLSICGLGFLDEAEPGSLHGQGLPEDQQIPSGTEEEPSWTAPDITGSQDDHIGSEPHEEAEGVTGPTDERAHASRLCERSQELRLFVKEAKLVRDGVRMIETKAGKVTGSPWKLYKVTLSDGHDYATFSQTAYTDALHASENGLPVTIEWEPGKREGQRNLTSLTLIEGPE